VTETGQQEHTMSTDNKAVIRRFIHEVNNQHDVDVVDELCTPDHVLSHPTFPMTVHGTARLKIALRSFFETFPDYFFTIRELVGEGDRVALRFGVTGTNSGQFGGQSPTGKSFWGTGLVLYQLEGGRISSTVIEEDILEMLNQLGLVPRNLTLLQLLRRAGVIRLLERLGKIPTGTGIDFDAAEPSHKSSAVKVAPTEIQEEHRVGR
jgi:predicted ester cyclase